MVGDIRLGISAKDAQLEVKSITERFKELNAEMENAAKNKDWSSFNSLASAMNNLEGYKKGLINESHGVPSNLPMQNPVNNLVGGATNTINAVGNGISAAGSGSVGGMLASGSQLTQSAIKGLGALGLGAGATAGILGAAGLIFAGGAAANKASQFWEDQMGSAIDSNAFYNTNRFNMSASENSAFLRSRYNTASEIRKGTQYTTEEVMEIQNEMAKYGYNAQSSQSGSRAIINAMANTGASKDSLAKLSGLSNLYGYDGAMAIQNVYQGLKDSGMTDARMDEFLNSITQAMEDGVSKGFVGSVEDIVNNVTLFSRLSGGSEIWTGKSGAERVNKIGSGFANAVNLNSTTDMMMYGAALSTLEGKSPKEIMALTGGINDPTVAARIIMEQGANGNYFSQMLGNFAQTVNSQFADMPEYQIQTYMKSFGLNTTGATQLMNLMKTWEESGYSSNFNINTKASNIINANENKSTETEYKSAINTIKDKVVGMGQDVLSLKNWFVNDNEIGTTVSESSENLLVSVLGEEGAKKVVADMENQLGKDAGLVNILNPDELATMAIRSEATSIEEKVKLFASSTMAAEVGKNKKVKLGHIYDETTTEGMGKDNLDNIFLSLSMEAAMQGALKGKKNTGTIEQSEMEKIMLTHDTNSNVKSAYRSGDEKAYITALKQMLTELFGEVKFTSY